MGTLIAVDDFDAFIKLVEELNGAKVAVDASSPPRKELNTWSIRVYAACRNGLVVALVRHYHPPFRDPEGRVRVLSAFKKAHAETRKALAGKGFLLARGWVQLSEVADCEED